jgi:UDP-glucose 4-epimerase
MGKMRIIVNGGAGFIASHITDAYIKAGHRVAVIDGILPTSSRKNVNPKAKFYKADIRDRALMERIFRKERPEVVNHHAAIAVIAQALRDPIPTLNVNLLGTANVLLAFGKYGRGKNRRFIFASSGAVYGTPKEVPATEKTPTNPESAYGLSKLLGEELVEFYARQYGFHYVLFRYPNVYGPRQNPKGEAGVTAIFGGLMKAGKRPTIFGDGTKSRDSLL